MLNVKCLEDRYPDNVSIRTDKTAPVNYSQSLFTIETKTNSIFRSIKDNESQLTEFENKTNIKLEELLKVTQNNQKFIDNLLFENDELKREITKIKDNNLITNIQHINELYTENPKLKEQVNTITNTNVNNNLEILKLREELEYNKKYIKNLEENNSIKTKNNEILKNENLILNDDCNYYHSRYKKIKSILGISSLKDLENKKITIK
jgi:vacuolar-type H+-ATPase subunit I/STV1